MPRGQAQGSGALGHSLGFETPGYNRRGSKLKQATRQFAGHSFKYVGLIQPERDMTFANSCPKRSTGMLMASRYTDTAAAHSADLGLPRANTTRAFTSLRTVTQSSTSESALICTSVSTLAMGKSRHETAMRVGNSPIAGSTISFLIVYIRVRTSNCGSSELRYASPWSKS